MNFPKRIPVQFCCLHVAALLMACLIAGCSESTDSVSGDAPTSMNSMMSEVNNDENVSTDVSNASDTETDTTTDVVNNDASDGAPKEPVVNNPVVVDPLVQNTVSVNFDITVPAYQSNELRIELVWGDTTLIAKWVGDEYWSASAELPTDTEHSLTVTFYDRNGDIVLARFSEEFKTGSNAIGSFQIFADQFDASQFDEDGDGVNNLDELMSGTDPSIDEGSVLEIRDYYLLSNISTSRMSVSTSFEARLSDERPYFDTFERLPVEGGYPGTQLSVVDIDAEGNGTLTFSEYIQGRILELVGTRTNSGSAITWEGTRFAHDDYGHRVSFTNTVTVVDENTRAFAEEIKGTNVGTYYYGWDISSNLTGRLMEETSLCKPIAGTVVMTYRENTNGNTLTSDATTSTTTVSKEIDDPYWKVVRVNSVNETSEYFARELLIYRPNSGASAALAPEFKYFICDFVDL